MKKTLLILAFFFGLLAAETSFAKEGILRIGVHQHTGKIPSNGVAIPFLTLKLTAEDARINFSGMDVYRKGLSSANDFERVWAAVDRTRSYNVAVLPDDKAKIHFKKPIEIQKGKSKILKLYGNLRKMGKGRSAYFTIGNVYSSASGHRIATRKKKRARDFSKPITKKRRLKSYKIVCENRKCRRVRREK